MRVRGAHEVPVALGAEVKRPVPRFQHVGVVIAASRLDEQHFHLGILGQSSGHDGAGGSRATDDEIEMVFIPRAIHRHERGSLVGVVSLARFKRRSRCKIIAGENMR